jgi:hypothetical protein
MPKRKAPAPARPSNPPTAQAALMRVEPELRELEAAEIATVNLDISQAVSIALGALPGILEYADRLEELPGFDPKYVNQLETYTLAAWYAHLQAAPGTTTQSELRKRIEEATTLRTALLGDAEALVRRGIFDAQAVAQVRAGQGHQDLANDLVVLSAMFQQVWETIGGRTLATLAEIDRAAELGPALVAALGVRAAGVGPTPSEAAEQRMRAYTLFMRAYGEVRRGLSYLRWHEGDADLIAPSLYRGRGGRPASAGSETTPATGMEPVAPLPTGLVLPSPTNGAGAHPAPTAPVVEG